MIRLVALLSCIGWICATPLNHNVDNERVIGGHDAPLGKWRWQVSLQKDAYGQFFYHICGGTIIDPFHIMTAAHCIMSMDPREYRAAVGEHSLSADYGTEQYSLVERIFIHPGWTGDLTHGNDIAIMRLANPLYEDSYVSYADLPYPDQMLPHGFTCYVTGWGLVYSGGHSADILQEAPIKVVEHSICSTHEWWGNIALKTMVCAGGDGIISGCQGDSGGPLSCFTDGAWRVHGVVSYGPSGNCNQVSKPTVFTRVSSFTNWITSVQSS